jgi:hypothetical protein
MLADLVAKFYHGLGWKASKTGLGLDGAASPERQQEREQILKIVLVHIAEGRHDRAWVGLLRRFQLRRYVRTVSMSCHFGQVWRQMSAFTAKSVATYTLLAKEKFAATRVGNGGAGAENRAADHCPEARSSQTSVGH